MSKEAATPTKGVFYKKSLRQIFNKFTKIQSEIREWREEKTEDRCTIFTRRMEGSKNLVVKAVMEFETDASAKDFTEFFVNVTSRPNNSDRLVCEPDNVYYLKLATVEENTQVYHVRTTTESRSLVKDRDFIIVRTSKTKGNIGLIYGGSFKDDASLYPRDVECVRASMTMFSWVVQKKENHVMKVDYYCHIEPNESLAAFVFNMNILKRGLVVKRYIHAFIKKRGPFLPAVEQRVEEKLAITQEMELEGLKKNGGGGFEKGRREALVLSMKWIEEERLGNQTTREMMLASFEEFEIIETIGGKYANDTGDLEGAMAHVYAIKFRGKPYAMKVYLNIKGDTRFGQNWAKESKFQALVQQKEFPIFPFHPNIIRLYYSRKLYNLAERGFKFHGIDQTFMGNNTVIFITDLYECDLKRYLAEKTRDAGFIEERIILKILRGLISGLVFLNVDQRIIHLDLKLPNIFVNRDLEKIVIADFGCHRCFQGMASFKLRKTKDFNISGTACYHSPEIFNTPIGKSIDFEKNDVFALGLLLCEMCGVPVGEVFENNERNEEHFKGIENTRYSPELKKYVSHLLFVDPQKRFSIKEAERSLAVLELKLGATTL